MFIVVCYSIHSRKIVSVDKFETYEDACSFLEEDVKNTYEEEVSNGGNNVEFDLDEDSATLSSSNEEFIWTWEIIEV